MMKEILKYFKIVSQKGELIIQKNVRKSRKQINRRGERGVRTGKYSVYLHVLYICSDVNLRC